MSAPGNAVRIEARWPVALAVITTALLLAVLPGCLRQLPDWGPWLISIVLMIVPANIATLLYWHIDRGGPDARLDAHDVREPDRAPDHRRRRVPRDQHSRYLNRAAAGNDLTIPLA